MHLAHDYIYHADRYVVSYFTMLRLTLTGILASLAAAAASPLSTDSLRVPSLCGLSGLGPLGTRRAEKNCIHVVEVKYAH